MNTSENCKCIATILKTICLAQKEAKKIIGSDTCSRRFLGGSDFQNEYNTRPVQLYLNCCNGNSPLQMPADRNDTEPSGDLSNIFRLEKIEDCCATFRVLLQTPDSGPIIATNSFFTVDLKCICMIRCLDDIYIDCV